MGSYVGADVCFVCKPQLAASPTTGDACHQSDFVLNLVSSLLRSAASPPFEGVVEAAEIQVT